MLHGGRPIGMGAGLLAYQRGSILPADHLEGGAKMNLQIRDNDALLSLLRRDDSKTATMALVVNQGALSYQGRIFVMWLYSQPTLDA
jgi:hypothetical protein